jgi:hypothetical protein
VYVVDPAGRKVTIIFLSWYLENTVAVFWSHGKLVGRIYKSCTVLTPPTTEGIKVSEKDRFVTGLRV